MKRFILLAVPCLMLSPGAAGQRLPDSVVPESYDLTFEPDLAAATFSGNETIHIRLRQPATSITLNSAEINYLEATITVGESPQTATVVTDEKNQTATLTVPNAIRAGPAEIRIRYRGILNGQLRGFYLSRTPRRRYAATQFEATAHWPAMHFGSPP